MEVVVNQWKDTENEVEEVGLQRKQSLQRSSTSSSDTDVEGGGGVELDQSMMKQKFHMTIGTEINNEMIFQREHIEESILPASDSRIPGDPSSLNIVTTERVGMMIENVRESQELYLERVFQKPPTHGFYCPNCNACIEKVYIQQPLQSTDTIRCSSCFSFLIPIGSWLFPGLVSDEDGALENQVTGSSNKNRLSEQIVKGRSGHKAPKPGQSVVSQSVAKEDTTSKPAGKQTIQIVEDAVLLGPGGAPKASSEIEHKISGTSTSIGNVPGNNVKSQDSSNLHGLTSQGPKGPVARKKEHFWSDWAVIGEASEASKLKQREIDPTKNSDWKVIMPAASLAPMTKQSEIDFPDKKMPDINEEIILDVGSTEPARPASPDRSTQPRPSIEPPVVQEAASSKTWEILKSIVYGGLTEFLASLSVVTSAASADATTLNIVALAIANLIGGLFALIHNLRELKAEQPKRASSQTDTPVDRYNELLGQRRNFYLHAFFAIISFIVFGLVPPVVYGFSFRESEEKHFKLAAVAGVSLLCITLLSIAKAHIQRPNNYVVYFQTLLYYVSTGAVASVLSYLAGDLVKKLLEKLPWFESTSNSSLQVPGMMSIQNPRWGSY